MSIDLLLGLQWGDEGKGKIVDVLTTNYDIIARFQGGPNASPIETRRHTRQIANGKFGGKTFIKIFEKIPNLLVYTFNFPLFNCLAQHSGDHALGHRKRITFGGVRITVVIFFINNTVIFNDQISNTFVLFMGF